MTRKRKTEPGNTTLPDVTFAAITADYSDGTSVEDLVDGEAREVVETWLCGFEKWRRIQSDRTEAEARAAYAEHAAAHLVGIFPNTRVAAESYAAAAGEELAGFSADVVRIVAKRMRATRRQLPTIAELIEAARAEVEARWAQYRDYAAALRDFNACVARGKAEAQRLAAKLAEHGAALQTCDLLFLHEELTLHPMGIKRARGGGEKELAMLRHFSRMASGDADAIAWAVEAVAKLRAANAELSEHHARAAAGQPGAEDSASECWQRLRELKEALCEQLCGFNRDPATAQQIGSSNE
jgi:hypothetical protein